MTTKETLKAIGKKGTISIGGLRVNVKITDVKNSYGHDRYFVTPVSGEGEIWVEQNPLLTLSTE